MSKSSVKKSLSQLDDVPKVITILLIEDDLVEARLIQEILQKFDLNRFALTHVQRLQTGLSRWAKKTIKWQKRKIGLI